MSTSTVNDMKLYDKLLAGSYYERIVQNIKLFNEASGGALVMVSEFLQGDYAKESFFKNFSALSRRDDTSTADANAVKVVQDENISVKLKRKFLAEITADSFRTMGYSEEEFAQMCGEQMADEVKQEALERVLTALIAFITSVPGLLLDVSGDGNAGSLTHVNVNKMNALLGDKSSNIVAYVMSGAAFHAWAGSMLGGTAPQFNDSGISVYNGGVPTLGRPVIVTDSPALVGTGKFTILGLQRGAAKVTISEPGVTVFDTITGKENIIKRVQSESAYNLELRGAKWNVQGGGRNPSTGAVATGSNWIQTAASIKDLPGTALVVTQ